MRETIITVTAILSVTTISIFSLIHGIDGIVLSSAFTIIGGLGGYSIGKRKSRPSSIPSALPQPPSNDG